MATYRVPKQSIPALLKEPTPKEALKKTELSIANMRSGDYPATQTGGVLIRGCGAATKGKLARGPMG